MLLALPIAAQAQFTFTTNNGAVTITKYTGSGGTVIIPSATNGYPVTAIGTAAFFLKTAVTNVTIPNSVTTIGTNAFGASGLTSVTIPNSVTNIGFEAFYGCSSLTSVTIPNSITTIGDYAFTDCSGLTSVTIPNSITTIGNYTFTACFGLTSVTIPNNVTTIGDGAFQGCSGLTSVTIPNSVTNIGIGAFNGCSGLTKAYFQGNAPTVNGGTGSADNTVFSGETGTVYYLPGITGWGSTFGGWPTAQWLPQAQSAGGLNSNTNGFGFNINWTSGQTVVVLASTDLQNWTPVITNTLSSDTNYFSDSQWTNYPQRFYRVRSP
jgi:hypothetical protein